MARPFTFHLQLKEDIQSQNAAEDFRNFFGKSEVIKALDKSEIIHFARTVLIPNDRITAGTKGTFALQVVLVYDGTLKELITWICATRAIREIFVGLSEIGKVTCTNAEDREALADYIFQNNINRTARELHAGHRLTVKKIRSLFSMVSGSVIPSVKHRPIQNPQPLHV
jgi:hypothetical protein